MERSDRTVVVFLSQNREGHDFYSCQQSCMNESGFSR
jgi:hypothetical protein